MSDLLNKASLVMIPSGYKEDVVYSAIPSDGSGDLALTRASNGTRINSAGLVEDCPWNIAQQSETFNVSPWTNYGTGTITANATTAPNGTTTADLFVPNTTNYTHAVEQNIGTTSGAITMSVYAKAAGYNWLVLNTYIGGAKYTYFDLQNGVIGTTASGVTASIENVGNGWFKLICTLTGGASTYFSIISATANNTSSFAGNGTSGTYLWGAQLNIGSTAKPYFPTTDRLNVARLTYQNGGGGCPALLLEKQSTNLLTYSEQFDNAYWVKTASSINSNTTTSPNGTVTADQWVGNNTSGQHILRHSYFAIAALSTVSYSFYIKADGISKIGYREDAQTGRNGAFNIATKSVIFVTSGDSITFENAANDFVRVTLTTVVGSGGVLGLQLFLLDSSYTSGNPNTYSSNVSSTQGVIIWGAQMEASSYPTSYIPTTSASATRVADACFKTGIGSLIGQTEGVLFVDVKFTHLTSGSNQYLGQIRLDSGNRILIYRDSATNAIGVVVLKAAGTIFSSVSAVSSNTRHKVAIAYKSGDLAFYIDGNQIATSSTTFSAYSLLSAFDLGNSNTSGTPTEFGDYEYNEALLFPTRLTNAELISLTTI